MHLLQADSEVWFLSQADLRKIAVASMRRYGFLSPVARHRRSDDTNRVTAVPAHLLRTPGNSGKGSGKVTTAAAAAAGPAPAPAPVLG
jgi:hypothetical protein